MYATAETTGVFPGMREYYANALTADSPKEFEIFSKNIRIVHGTTKLYILVVLNLSLRNMFYRFIFAD